MSNIYQTFNPELQNYETPDNSLSLPVGSSGLFPPSSSGRDIDKNLSYVQNDDDGYPQNFYDYDLKSTPSVSGPQLIIPTKYDTGIPEVIDSTILNNQSSPLDDMIGEVNNGRVPDIIDNYQRTPLQEKMIVIDNDNQTSSVKGILEQTALSDTFFSDMNTDIIQQSVRYNVYKNTNKVIAKQSENTLYIIMRSIMLQYGNFQTSAKNLIEELQNLNDMVIRYSSENITSNVQQYFGYLSDIQRLPQPIERPVYNNKKNYTYDISNLL
jgi:hypothetical protein